jgi:glycerol-3-phosphate acyltransferase PlsY
MGMFAAAMAALIIARHRGNIRRLLAGTDNKIGAHRPPAQSGGPRK